MTDIIYFDASAPVPCYLRRPAEFRKRADWPLIIGLHGGGRDAEEFMRVYDRFDNPEFLFAAPRAPYPFSDAGRLAYDWCHWSIGDLEVMERGTVASEEWIAACVRLLKTEYPDSPIYLLGFSQGAFMTYRAGIRYHDLLDGLIVLAGPGIYQPLISPVVGRFESNWPTRPELAAASGLRVFIAHGREDTAVDYTLGECSLQVLTETEFDVVFHPFAGGHSLSDAQTGGIFQKIASWLEK